MPLQNTQVGEALSSSDEVIKGLLSQILNLNIHDESNQKIIISSLNKLLSTSKTRLEGLEILHLIIRYCSASVITENALHWMSHCLVKHPGDDLTEAKLVTIGLIVNYASTDQDFTKKFISDYISKVLDMCLGAKSNPHEVGAALETLTICMKNYHSWFTQHKGRVEKYLETFLDCTDGDVLVKAARCFHYLQQVGGAGVEGVTHKTNFSTTFTKLCVTAHKLFDDFFENETEIEQYNKTDGEHFEYMELHLDSQKVSHITGNRITNCLEFLKTMLLEGYPVAKEIKPLEILNLVKRGCAIHRCTSADQENSLDDYIFSVLLIGIQVKLLQLLRIFIFWSQSNLFPYSYMVTKILVDAFSRNQSCICFKQNQVYQETVYKVLKYWFQVSKCGVKPQLQEKIIAGILNDIRPSKITISLSINTEISKMKSKKARKKAVQECVLGNNRKKDVITEGERDIETNSCNIALDALTQILESSTLNVKPSLLQELYCTVAGTLLELNSGKVTEPYSDINCQIKLYKALVAFYEQENLKIYPPLQLSLQVLNKGSRSKNRHIAFICERGISILEKMCQPVAPSLDVEQADTATPGRGFETAPEQILDEENAEIDIESIGGSVMEGEYIEEMHVVDTEPPEGVNVTVEEPESDDVQSVDVEVASIAGTIEETCKITTNDSDCLESLPAEGTEKLISVEIEDLTEDADNAMEEGPADEDKGNVNILDVTVIKVSLSQNGIQDEPILANTNDAKDNGDSAGIDEVNLEINTKQSTDSEIKKEAEAEDGESESPKKKMKFADEADIKLKVEDFKDEVLEGDGGFVDEVREF